MPVPVGQIEIPAVRLANGDRGRAMSRTRCAHAAGRWIRRIRRRMAGGRRRSMLRSSFIANILLNAWNEPWFHPAIALTRSDDGTASSARSCSSMASAAATSTLGPVPDPGRDRSRAQRMGHPEPRLQHQPAAGYPQHLVGRSRSAHSGDSSQHAPRDRAACAVPIARARGPQHGRACRTARACSTNPTSCPASSTWSCSERLATV